MAVNVGRDSAYPHYQLSTEQGQFLFGFESSGMAAALARTCDGPPFLGAFPVLAFKLPVL